MKTAFETLGVPEETDDQTVKRAYLKKVKLYPPDSATEQFQQIRSAYEAIKDARSRIKYQLFHQQEADFDRLLERAFDNEQAAAFDKRSFLKLLQSTVDKLYG